MSVASDWTNPNDLDITLDIFGQQRLIQIYTQISLCFAVTDDSTYPAIVHTLSVGLGRLTRYFPWLAGQIVNEDTAPGDSGVFKIKPFEKLPRLVVKDLRDDSSMPSMEVLRQTNFPATYLNENVIAPQNTLPSAESTGPRPVFILQANFITGGLILTIVAAHSAMDMTGQGQIMNLLSKACHGVKFTKEELESGFLRGRNVIPLLEDANNLENTLEHQIIKSPTSSLVPTAIQGCSWTYFRFPPASLAALKALASASSTLHSKYISTDDALSAYIWKSVTRARFSRLSIKGESTFGRAVNVRRYLGIPETYVGFVQNMTYNKSSVNQLIEESLGEIASKLRYEVDPETSKLGYNTRALATLFENSLDKSVVSFGATINPSVDMMLSSWAKVDCYAMDFNLGLGGPECVRRPQFDPVEGLIYLMPRNPDGEISVAICLRDLDLEKLKRDEDFMKYASYIG
jgi:trichothecene 3-O-acetyltransferase